MKFVNKKTGVLAGGILALTIAVSACGPTQLSDLRNTPDVYPNYQGTILNVDGFPNVSLICFQGTAIITNTRSNTNMELAPTLDAFCAKYIGQKAGVDGGS